MKVVCATCGKTISINVAGLGYEITTLVIDEHQVAIQGNPERERKSKSAYKTVKEIASRNLKKARFNPMTQVIKMGFCCTIWVLCPEDSDEPILK